MQSANIGAGVNMENKMSATKDKFYVRSGNHRLLVEEKDISSVVFVFFSSILQERIVDFNGEDRSVFVNKMDFQLSDYICISKVGFGGIDYRNEICGNDKEELKLYEELHKDDVFMRTAEYMNAYIKLMRQVYGVNIVFKNGDEEHDSTHE